jgi:hypothetical protein
MNDENDLNVEDDWKKEFENLYQNIKRDKRMIEKEIKTQNENLRKMKKENEPGAGG